TSVAERDIVIPITAHGACGQVFSFELEAREQGRGARKQTLLYAASLVLFLGYRLYLRALLLDALSVINRDCDVACQSLQNFYLRAGKSVEVVMGRVENADDPVANFQRNHNFGAGMRFAGAVEQFLGYIGRVVRFPGRDDLTR